MFKRNCRHGITKRCFCEKSETVQHLFISRPLAKLILHIVYMDFRITPPTNIINLFGNWLHRVEKKNSQIRVGSCALLWAMACANEIIFNNTKFIPLHMIRLVVHWIRA